MPTVRRSAKAAEDLEEIWCYIAEDSFDAADRVLDRIGDVCLLLAKNPGMGLRRAELGPRIYSFPVEKYVIFYRRIRGGIEVARVLHGSRDIDALF